MNLDKIILLSQSLIPLKRFDRFVWRDFPSQSHTGSSAIENNFSMLSLIFSFVAESIDLPRTAVRYTVQVIVPTIAVVVFSGMDF